MKRNAQLWMAAGLVLASLLVGCKKNEKGADFSAKIEGDNAKTELVGSKIHWTSGDQIILANSANQFETLTLEEGPGTSVGKFRTSASFSLTSPYYAIYPAANAAGTSNSLSGANANFNVPATQTFPKEDSFAEEALPMVAKSTTQQLPFKNMMGGLCFPLKGSGTVGSIVITSNNTSESLWGTYTVDCSSDDPTMTHQDGTGSNVVTLNCTNGVALDGTNAKNFIVMLPPGTLRTGCKLTVNDTGGSLLYELTSSRDFNITRNKISGIQTIDVTNCSISATVDPAGSGTVTGTGSYRIGASCTLTATPATNYTFTNWTENGQVVPGAGASYTFTVTDNRTLQANFTYVPPTYTINVSANPSNGGTISHTGGTWSGNTGTYSPNASCTVTATPASGYILESWTVNGSDVTWSRSYSFTVTSNITLTAKFVAVPANAIPGLFLVSGSMNNSPTRVWFSKGNVKYTGSAWEFHTNQYDRVGNTNQYTTENNVARDVFAWSMNGQPHKPNYDIYRPYQYGYWAGGGDWSAWYPNACFAYQPGSGSYGYDLNSSTGQADWGYNFGDSWRTPTSTEWSNLLSNHSTKRWCTVNNVPGYAIRPDGNSEALAESYTAAAWTTEQNKGTLFLPAAGIRYLSGGTWYGSSMSDLRLYNATPEAANYGSYGHYWSATHSSTWYNAYYLYFYNNTITTGETLRNHGCSVRLIKNR